MTLTETSDVDLLKILQAHGQQFLDSFPNMDLNTRKRKRKLDPSPSPHAKRYITTSMNNDEEEEWLGIPEFSDQGTQSDFKGEKWFEQGDDDFTGKSSSAQMDVTVFQDFSSDKVMARSKFQTKAFMSSKISKMREEISSSSEHEKTTADIEDERSNAQNDALLHRLVHTKILSGSLNPDLDLTPAHRRKALAGRVLELSGEVKLGKGEKSVREKERNRASKYVREGIMEKQKERSKHHLEEAKNVGNYHPAIKKLFGSSSTASKKRERGLKLGVGKFNGGLLKLSREEIDVVERKEYSRGGYRARGSKRRHLPQL